jgi:hypothetical protein
LTHVLYTSSSCQGISYDRALDSLDDFSPHEGQRDVSLLLKAEVLEACTSSIIARGRNEASQPLDVT